MSDGIPVLEAQSLRKCYDEGVSTVEVLADINLQVFSGERIAITGTSGSGKSTLLNLLGGLDTPSTGKVWIGGEDITELNENRRALIRNRTLGFVYQFHHLLPEFSALENVSMPLLMGPARLPEVRERAEAILDRVGLARRVQHKPHELSGGERQRVAIARALVGNPACVLMDEPTGNLDRATAEKIQALMAELNDSLNTAFVVVTHDMHLAERMDRVLNIEDGRLLPQDIAPELSAPS